jgi:hypothetical protein
MSSQVRGCDDYSNSVASPGTRGRGCKSLMSPPLPSPPLPRSLNLVQVPTRDSYPNPSTLHTRPPTIKPRICTNLKTRLGEGWVAILESVNINSKLHGGRPYITSSRRGGGGVKGLMTSDDVGGRGGSWV